MDKYHLLAQFPFLSHDSLADIIWAAEGIKPLSKFEFAGVPKKEVDECTDALRGCGLFVKYAIGPVSRPLQSVWIALAEASIHKALLAERDSKSAEEKWRRLGRVYGYPVTAVAGFVSNERAAEEKVLPEVFTVEELAGYFATVPFRLSKKHWRQEAVVVRVWITALKKAAPTTYDRILSLYLEYLERCGARAQTAQCL